uniref:Transposase n=2 Tax=Bursaphelenchus xylophilus TaxID=6326 RepID=A0A1I7SCF1_BURXY
METVADLSHYFGPGRKQRFNIDYTEQLSRMSPHFALLKSLREMSVGEETLPSTRGGHSAYSELLLET